MMNFCFLPRDHHEMLTESARRRCRQKRAAFYTKSTRR